MKTTDLLKDHTYLLQFGTQQTLINVTILMITEKAFNVRWNTNAKHETWELADKFCNNYTLIEDITDLTLPQQTEKIKPITMVASSKLVNCYVCRGIGTVPDSKSTAGRTTCPACNGARMISETIELTQK